MKKVIFLCCFLACITSAKKVQAQIMLDSLNAVSVTLTPTSIFNYYSRIQAGLEIGLNKIGFLEFEGAFLLRDRGSLNEDVRNGNAFAFSYKLPFDNAFLDRFIISLHYRKTYLELMAQFERMDGLFNQVITYNQERIMIGPTIGIATTHLLESWVQVEFAARLGVGFISSRNEGIPEDARRLQEFSLFNNRSRLDDGDFRSPILGGSVKFKFGKVNYRIKKF